MTMWKRHVYRLDDAGADAGGGAAPAPAPAAPSPAPAAPAPSPAPAPGAPAPAPVAGYWKDDWRERLASGDDKTLKQLQRYASPEDVWKKARSLEQRLSSGELKPTLPKDATPEQIAEYRTAAGIPDKHDGYDVKDMKIAEVDKPMFDAVFKELHGANASPDVVKATVKAWNGIKESALAAQAESDKAQQTRAEDELRGEWGPEYRRNMNLLTGFLDGKASPEFKDLLMGGRLADGTPIGSSPAALKLLVSLALVDNPTGVVVPGGDAQKADSIKGELEKLQKVPAAKKTPQQDQRQRDLIDAAIKHGIMDAGGNWKA